MESQAETDSGYLERSGSFLENEQSMAMSRPFEQLTSPRKHNRRHTRESEINQRLLNQANDLLLQNENLKQLTINKLRYDSLQLIGREKEIQQLKSVVDRAMMKRTSGRKEVVFIGGYSGVGKSALADTLEDYIATMEGGVFLRGKFGMNNIDEPYTAIAEAFNGFFQGMKETHLKEEEKSTGMFADLREVLIKELGSALNLLANLIPSLENVAESGTMSPVRRQNDEAGRKRWKYAFLTLTRVLSSYFSPMVLLLEDLQWIDISSLEIIDLLIKDKLNPNPLVVVGSYRSNEVDDGHVLLQKMNELSSKQETFNFKLTDVQLSSLDVDEVNKVVMTLLSIDEPERTKNLANICFKRTLGNPFFVIEFVTMLEMEGLLSFNLGLLKWVWSENEIEKATMSTANVVDLLQARMKKMPEDLQHLMQYAACLGSTFKVSMIDLVWREHSGNSLSADVDGLPYMLTLLEESNYIEKIAEGVYCWVHDKVQEAALSFGKASSPSFQFEVGSLLLESLSEKELDVSLFDVANLVNRGKVPRRPEYAELNLRAAQKARKISAFHSAAIFANNGIRLLPSNVHSSHPQLALELYTIGAEMNYAIGDMKQMEVYIEDTLSQAIYSTLDKFPLYRLKATKLSVVESNHRKAISLCIQVLKMLGCNLGYNRALMPLIVRRKHLQTVRMVKKRKRKSYTELGPMTDKTDQAIMHLLARIGASSYPLNDVFINVLSTCEQVQMTLKCGISEISGHPFCALGVICAAYNGDYVLAKELGETGLFLESLMNSSYDETATNFISYSMLFPWTRSLSSSCKELSRTYTLGMRSGNTEHATWAIIVAEVLLPFQMGKNLNFLLTRCHRYTPQMEELKQHGQLEVIRLFREGALVLTGEQDHPNFASNTFDLPVHNELKKFVLLMLCIISGDFEEAAARAIETGDQFHKMLPCNSAGMMETFYRALAMYAMARQTKQLKYKRRAKQIHKKIKSWVKKGNPNVQHYDCLLKAEKAALNKKEKAARAFYNYAVKLAARSGYIHDAALINERYAGYMKEIGDEEESSYRIEEAIRFYRDWGANGKVESLSKVAVSRGEVATA